MAAQEDLPLVNDPETIRAQIEETRAALSEKLETLHEGVRDTMAQAQAQVEKVKESLNIRTQIGNHPLVAIGVSVATGYMVGRMLSPRPEPQRTSPYYPSYTPDELADRSDFSHTRREAGFAPPPTGATSSKTGGMFSELIGELTPDLADLKSIALGTLVGVLRDVFVGGVPKPFETRFNEVIDRFTEKIGGKPLAAAQPGAADRSSERSRAEDINHHNRQTV